VPEKSSATRQPDEANGPLIVPVFFWYLCLLCIRLFAVIWACIMAIYISVDIIELANIHLNNHAWIYAFPYRLFQIAAYTLVPAAVLCLAAAQGILENRGEYTALRASGMGPLRISVPFVCFCLSVCLVSWLLTGFAGPGGMKRFFALSGNGTGESVLFEQTASGSMSAVECPDSKSLCSLAVTRSFEDGSMAEKIWAGKAEGSGPVLSLKNAWVLDEKGALSFHRNLEKKISIPGTLHGGGNRPHLETSAALALFLADASVTQRARLRPRAELALRRALVSAALILPLCALAFGRRLVKKPNVALRTAASLVMPLVFWVLAAVLWSYAGKGLLQTWVLFPLLPAAFLLFTLYALPAWMR